MLRRHREQPSGAVALFRMPDLGRMAAMTPSTGTALVILVAFILPGFVTVMLQERTFRRAQDPTPVDRLLRALYFSLGSYLLLAAVAVLFGLDRPWFEDLYERYKHDPAQLVWRGALAVLIPASLIAITTWWWHTSALKRWFQRKLGFDHRHEAFTAWDEIFNRQLKAFVRGHIQERRACPGLLRVKELRLVQQRRSGPFP